MLVYSVTETVDIAI